MTDEQSDSIPKRQEKYPNLLAGPVNGWKPGESGNPNGRPPNENSITFWLKKLLNDPNGGGKTNAETIAKKAIAKAKAGELPAMEFVANRTEGKPKQLSEVTGKDGAPLIPRKFRISFGKHEYDPSSDKTRAGGNGD